MKTAIEWEDASQVFWYAAMILAVLILPYLL